MKDKFPLFLNVWLVVAVSSVILAGMVYTTVQQSLRLSANAAPATAVDAISDILQQGASPDQIIPPTQTELAKNYSVFAIIFDTSGKPLASSVSVNGQSPSLPSGVFDTAKKKGEYRFTWMPQGGLREAVVLMPVSVAATSTSTPSAGFIAAGQSLTETEKIIQGTTLLAGVGLLLLLIVSFFLSWWLLRDAEKHHAHHEHSEHPHEHPHEPAV